MSVSHLLEEILKGLQKAAQRGAPIARISADSWVVDYDLHEAFLR